MDYQTTTPASHVLPFVIRWRWQARAGRLACTGVDVSEEDPTNSPEGLTTSALRRLAVDPARESALDVLRGVAEEAQRDDYWYTFQGFGVPSARPPKKGQEEAVRFLRELETGLPSPPPPSRRGRPRQISDDTLSRIARRYTELRKEEVRRPVAVLAQEFALPRSRMRDRLRAATKRGFLPPRTRSGAPQGLVHPPRPTRTWVEEMAGQVPRVPPKALEGLYAVLVGGGWVSVARVQEELRELVGKAGLVELGDRRMVIDEARRMESGLERMTKDIVRTRPGLVEFRSEGGGKVRLVLPEGGRRKEKKTTTEKASRGRRKR